MPEAERTVEEQRLREEFREDIDIERLASELAVDAVFRRASCTASSSRGCARRGAGAIRCRTSGAASRRSESPGQAHPISAADRGDHGATALLPAVRSAHGGVRRGSLRPDGERLHQYARLLLRAASAAREALLAGVAALGGYRGEQEFPALYWPITKVSPALLRSGSALAGVLVPLLAFALLCQLGATDFAALVGGLALALDNALLLETRILVVDASSSPPRGRALVLPGRAARRTTSAGLGDRRGGARGPRVGTKLTSLAWSP
jgi:hypothetical protein